MSEVLDHWIGCWESPGHQKCAIAKVRSVHAQLMERVADLDALMPLARLGLWLVGGDDLGISLSTAARQSGTVTEDGEETPATVRAREILAREDGNGHS